MTTQKIYESKYQRIFLDQSNAIMHNEWMEDSIQMDEEDFKSELLHLVRCVAENPVERQLIDTLNFRFIVSPQLQAWTDVEVTKKNKMNGVKKVALIMPQEYITQLSVQQALSEKEAKSLDTRFFSDMEEAKGWLLD
ncbi:hypothetical protein BKI52_28200 [marine bacterium AO1-C]|nr:hypothetical protein BKI52_28200 [marine bacterium AO1-C]